MEKGGIYLLLTYVLTYENKNGVQGTIQGSERNIRSLIEFMRINKLFSYDKDDKYYVISAGHREDVKP